MLFKEACVPIRKQATYRLHALNQSVNPTVKLYMTKSRRATAALGKL